MLKRIIGTLSTKALSAIINFVLVIATANLLGSQGRGEISLFLANVAFIGIISQLIGGTGLVYLASRYNIFQLILPSYLWNFIACVLTSGAITLLGQVPSDLVMHMFVLSVITGTSSIHLKILAGKEEISKFNMIYLLQGILVFIFTLALFYSSHSPQVIHYVYATYVAFIATLILSTVLVWPYINAIHLQGFFPTLKALVTTSITAQFSNVVQFMNYRLSYYFLNHFSDTRSVGVFSIGMSLSESIWLISSSIAFVQYTRIANISDKEEAASMSIKLVKLTFCLCLLAVVPLLLIPTQWYTFIFGADFHQVKLVILTLAPGIIIFATSVIFTHFFSGLGQYNVDNISSSLGLVTTLIGCSVLIPLYGMPGAGIATTLSYCTNFTYLYFRFNRATKFRLSAIIPNKQDLYYLKGLLQDYRSKTGHNSKAA
jgi:O-antigen/teichoic acid export membrane protein